LSHFEKSDPLVLFNHTHALPTVRHCTLRFLQSDKRGETLSFFTKEFAQAFPCLTHLRIIGPVRLFMLKLLLLTHLHLENVDTQHGFLLTRLESLVYLIAGVSVSFVGGVKNLRAVASGRDVNAEGLKKELYEKFCCELPVDKIQWNLNVKPL
jgi:hypothetical protein